MIFWGLAVPAIGDWPWGLVLALGGLAALLSLDDTSLAQTWLSQPLPAGILAGALGGDPLTGLAVGLPYQLITLGNLPVGQTLIGEQVGAVVAGVGGSLLAGLRFAPWGSGPGQSPTGLLGWILLAVVLFGVAGHGIVKLERRVHFLWMLSGHRSLRDGDLGRLERIQLRCLAITALRGLTLTLLWLAVLTFLWLPLFRLLPVRAEKALAVLPLLAVALAVGALADRYGQRVAWPWIGSGVAVAFFLARWGR